MKFVPNHNWVGKFFPPQQYPKQPFFLVGGFNPVEKYESKWESSPNRGEHKTYLKPPPGFSLFSFLRTLALGHLGSFKSFLKVVADKIHVEKKTWNPVNTTFSHVKIWNHPIN